MHHLLEGGADEFGYQPNYSGLPPHVAERQQQLHARALKKFLEHPVDLCQAVRP